MSSLTKGSRGASVIELQNILIRNGYTTISNDGIFGPGTFNAVKDFQKKSGLVADGIVGIQTFNALKRIVPSNDKKTLSQADFEVAAKKLGIEVASIMAVTEVEAKEAGFYPEGEPIVLFERHKFYKYLKQLVSLDFATKIASINPNLCNKLPGGYSGKRTEWFRLTNACNINRVAALMSASYGLFQIMGFNYSYCGFSNVEDFYTEMCISESSQLQIFVSFLLHKDNKSMLQALRNGNWAKFASLYNGPNYEDNDYDTKLLAAYRRYKKLH